jgi:ethanolamine utilization protein EutQ (cupin superfamily)
MTYDPNTSNARRFPRVITPEEIDAMPRLSFNKGIDTAIFLSRERDDARYFRQGYCYMERDHEPYNWKQTDFDETHYCLEGKIHLVVRDASGRKVVLEARRGEHIYLPAGYDYTLEASGVKTVFFWSSGPSPRAGLVEAPEYSRELKSLRKQSQ